MTLKEQYLRHGRRNHDHGMPDTERRVHDARVCEFLIFCDAQGVRRLQGVEQRHVALFLQEIQEHRGLSDWTVYKYKLALQTFAKRRGIRIKVLTSITLAKERKIQKVEQALNLIAALTPELRAQILEVLRGIL
jgi:hypothetical protein